MTTSVEERLERLESEREIVLLLHRYGHCIDYGDEEGFLDLLTDDAELHYDFSIANTRNDTGLERLDFVGIDEIAGFFRSHTHAPELFHKHLMIEPIIEIDGDTATATSYYARLDESVAGPVLSSFGRYRDELVRGPDSRWRMRSRTGEAESRVSRENIDSRTWLK